MKIYILFVICGKSVSNDFVETDASIFAKKANVRSNGFGTNIVEIWQDGKKIDSIMWEDFKKNLVDYI